jgi:arylsulfatase A-like enzyme
LIIASPEITKTGTVADAPVLSTDFFPTILSLLNKTQPIIPSGDGQNFQPILLGESLTQTRPLAWHYPHYHGSEWTPGAALRDGNWKIIEFYEFGDAELYNLAEDPGERHNLANVEPEKFMEMREKLRQWQMNMAARMPQPNAAWQPAKSPECSSP